MHTPSFFVAAAPYNSIVRWQQSLSSPKAID